MVSLSRKLLSFFAVLFIFCIFTASVHANEEVLFGPKDFKIKKWRFQLSFHRIKVDDPGEGILILSNKTPHLKNLKGYVSFNRRHITMKDFLKGSDTSFETKVTLRSENSLMVFLKGKPGATLSIEIRKKRQSLPPKVRFRAKPAFIERGKPVILAWKTKHADTCEIDQGIGPVSLNGFRKVWPVKTTTYTLTASGSWGSTEASATVRVKNAVPVANPQSITTNEDTPVPITLKGSDVDGDVLIYNVVSGPVYGSLSGTPPNLNYSPEKDYYGPDKFTFSVGDGHPGTTTAEVNITVAPVNDLPQAVDDEATVDEDNTLSIANVLANDKDVDQDSLTLISFTQPSHGTLEHKGNGNFSYSPHLNFNGSDAYSYTVSDGNGGSDTANVSVTINPVNDAPVADAGPDQTVSMTDTVMLDGSGSSDVEEDPLSYSWSFVSVPAGSTAALSDPSIVNPTFVADIDGLYEVQLIVNDGILDSAPDSVVITVEYVPPAEPETKLNASDAELYDSFGQSVSVGGNYAIVGATGDDDNGESSGAVYIYSHNSPWTEQAKLTASDGTEYDRFGSSVHVSGEYAIVGARGDTNYKGAAYIFHYNGSVWVEEAKLTASDGVEDDDFGFSVSLDGDYAVVGAPDNNAVGPYSGAVYVFKREGSTWTEQAKITASTADNSEEFGASVSIDGEYIVVGAPLGVIDEQYKGAAYIFKYDGSTWIREAKLAADDEPGDDEFGVAVAISGDHAIIGAFFDEGERGSAYVYKRDGSIWSKEGKLIASDPVSYGFGVSVSIDGDYAIVGADYAPADGVDYAGAAYLFVYDGATWTELTKIVSGDVKQDAAFGSSVAIDGTYIMVGAPNGDSASTSSTGAAYIYPLNNYIGKPSVTVIEPNGIGDIADGSFTIKWTDQDADDNAAISIFYDTDDSGSDGTLIVSGLTEDPDGPDDEYLWNTSGLQDGLYYIYIVIDDGVNDPVVDYGDGSIIIDHDIPEQIKITAGDAAPDDNFGGAVAIDSERIIVGARYEDEFGINSGAAYVYRRDGSFWIQQAKLTAGDAETRDQFGESVSISGDYAIVGAPWESSGYYTEEGAAYIFKWDGTNWIEQAKLIASDRQPSHAEYFGESVSISGDYAIVGADFADSTEGAAYIFRRDGSVWTEVIKLKASDAAFGDTFGSAVAIDGDYAIIGADADDDNGSGSGSAYIYRWDGINWIEEVKITASDAAAYYGFGISVSMSGGYAIIGAPGRDNDTGSAYIFKREGSSWIEQTILTPIDGKSFFGLSVDIDGDYAVVGAERDGNSSGSAYVYKREVSGWVLTQKIVSSDAEVNDNFGGSVAVNGTDGTFVVGTPNGDADPVIDSGAAYVYSFEDFTSPDIHIIEPGGVNDLADSFFTIKWADLDSDDNAVISLYYDEDNTGADGTLIASGLSEDQDGAADEYIWSTSGLPEGTEYYIYAIIDDGINPPVVDYSDNVITVLNHNKMNLAPFDPALGDQFGYSVDIDGDYAIVGAHGNDDDGSDSGSAYIYRRYGIWYQEAKFTAGDAAGGDNFGKSVSINGDYAIVGAPGDDNYAGSAYVFKRSGSAWLEQAKLTAGDRATGDIFGWSVAIHGDYAVIGAWGDDNYIGSAYVFKRYGSAWLEQAKLTASDRSALDYFGRSVSIDGQYVLVGAEHSSSGGVFTGAAYLFKRDGETWIQDKILTATYETWDENFGCSVDIDDPYLIVGARGLGYESVVPGAAYIFKREGESWNKKARLTANMPVDYDYFGASVAIEDDLVIIGATGNPTDPNMLGSAYIFDRQGEVWTLRTTLGFASPPDMVFGQSVALSGGNGIVGGPGHPDDESYPGFARISLLSRANISADYEKIAIGGSTTLSWSFIDATSVTIDNGIGEVTENGSITVSPTETTTYTMTAVGPWGTSIDSVTITVIVPPTVNISAEPLGLFPGESTTLTWSSTDADTCVIEPGIGSVALNGSLEVTPTETTTYTVTVTNLAGTAVDSVQVQAILPLEDVNYGVGVDEQQGGGGLVGETVRILDGNMVEIRSDLQFPSPNRLGLGLDAVYNSRNEILGSLGHGWTHTYEASLDPAFEIEGSPSLKIIDGAGKVSYFREGAPGEYAGAFGERSHVRAEAGGYVWYRLDGSRYTFSSSGRLVRIEDEVGNSLELAYDVSDRLETVTDMAGGRILTFHYNGNGLVDHISGPITVAVSTGIWVSYGYDADLNLTAVTYADGSGFDYAYTDTGDVHNMTEKKNKLNHLLNTWGYDTQDRAVSNFGRNGTGVSLVYVNEDQVNVTDAYGKERQYHLDRITGRKRVISITTTQPGGPGGFPYSASNAVSWTYDEKMRPTEIGSATGTVTQYLDYDYRGNPGTIKFALGTPEERVIAYTYHPDMNEPLTRTEESVLGTGDKETVWDYDDPQAPGDTNTPNESPTRLLYRIIETGYTKDTGGSVIPYEYITTNTYNARGQVLSTDGPLPGSGDTTAFIYDPATGNLLQIIRPLIGATVFSDYDNAGRVGRTTDVNNLDTVFTYDGRGRVTDVTNPDSSISTTLYNPAGEIQSETDEDNVTTTYTYDDVYGRLLKITDQDGNYIEHTYDTEGNLTEKAYRDPVGTLTNLKRWDYQHPQMPGRLYEEINHDDTFTRYDYDFNGNISSVTDPEGYATLYSYDALDRLKEVRQPDPGAGVPITKYLYDLHGNLSSVEDANHATTTYQYDDMGRLVQTASLDTGTMTYAYDEAGRLLNKIDAKGTDIQYAYDDLDRLTNVNFPTDPDISYTYDEGLFGIGRRTGIIDQSGSTGFAYDNRGRLVQKTSTIDGIDYTLSRSHTPGGRVSAITYPTGRTIDFVRNQCACRVDAIYSNYGGNTITLMENLVYRPFGGAQSVDTGAGGSIDNTSDLSGRLQVANPGAQTERTYEYYPDGNLKNVTVSNEKWKSRAYQYDALNRLTNVVDPYGAFPYTFTYDLVGNRLSKTRRTKTETYAYFAGTNKLQSIAGDDPMTFTYDLNGNTTGMGDKVLIYNQSNRLIRVEENLEILAEYVYNALGQRVTKEVDGTTTVFHYDFDGNIIGESDLGGTFTREYLYRGQNRLAMVDVWTQDVYTYLNDQLGTPQAITDTDGKAVWEAVYRPFGAPLVHPMSTLTNNFSFLGQYYDEETGLYYNYHRYYDPRTGRYLTPDPIGLAVSLNLYRYVHNNPINLFDVLGLFEINTALELLRNTPSGKPIVEELNKRKTKIIKAPKGSNPQRIGNEIYIDGSVSDKLAAISIAHEGTHVIDPKNIPITSDRDTLARELRAFTMEIQAYKELEFHDSLLEWLSNMNREELINVIKEAYDLDIQSCPGL